MPDQPNHCTCCGKLMPYTNAAYYCSEECMNKIRGTEPKKYVTVTHGMRGYFAVLIWTNPDGNFQEPWSTGLASYKTAEEAYPEAQSWAKDEGVPFVARKG